MQHSKSCITRLSAFILLSALLHAAIVVAINPKIQHLPFSVKRDEPISIRINNSTTRQKIISEQKHVEPSPNQKIKPVKKRAYIDKASIETEQTTKETQQKLNPSLFLQQSLNSIPLIMSEMEQSKKIGGIRPITQDKAKPDSL